jgi:LCP family protein required for cell wall assembly
MKRQAMFKNKQLQIYLIALFFIALVILVPVFRGGLTFAAPLNNNVSLIKAPAGSTPTATAFQPLSSTQTYIPTDYPTSTPTITPLPDRIIPGSDMIGVDPIQEPDNQITIMLLGSDQKYKGFIGRTDTIILLTINTKDDTVNVTSFPRDLYVHIPGWTNQRINTAFAHGGFKTLQDTLMHNFGFTPDYYVLVNLWAFEYFINDLGGIYVHVPRQLCDDKWGDGSTHCVNAGYHHFHGREALWYVRSRVTTNDFDRNYRQQLVLKSILDRLFSLNTLTRIPQLYNTYVNNVTTNLDLGTILSLAPSATKLSDSSRIKQFFINQDAVSSWISPAGAHVLLPRYAVIRNILEAALNAP